MQHVDQTLAALADPTRVEIVDRLSAGTASVSELAAGFSMSLRGVLKHVQLLEQAGLVRTIKQGRVRRCELRPDRLNDTARWMDDVRDRWERRLDRLERHLRDNNEPDMSEPDDNEPDTNEPDLMRRNDE
jgi:DNA-binding transcriptional ArsR family regulator